MIVGGDPIGAAEALKNGLIEEIVEGPASGGEAFARKLLAEKRPLRQLRDDDSKLAAAKADRSIFTNAVAAMTKKARGLEAPFAAADAVGDAIDLPFDEGLKKEREGFLKLVSSDQSKAQRYAFFAEREAARSPAFLKAPSRVPSSASPSSAPAPWAAASRCPLPMPAFPSP